MIDYCLTLIEYFNRFMQHCGNMLDWASENGIAQDMGRVIGIGFRYFWDTVLPIIAKWVILVVYR